MGVDSPGNQRFIETRPDGAAVEGAAAGGGGRCDRPEGVRYRTDGACPEPDGELQRDTHEVRGGLMGKSATEGGTEQQHLRALE